MSGTDEQANRPQRTEHLSRDDPAQHDGAQQQRAQDRGRSAVEWTTLGISALIVLGLVGVITWLYVTGGDEAAEIAVEPLLDQVREADGRYYLPIEITNAGGATAEDVRIEVELSGSGGESEASEVQVAFLAGKATTQATVVFASDPRQGELTVDVISYLNP